jgi:soluble P-type ATPase
MWMWAAIGIRADPGYLVFAGLSPEDKMIIFEASGWGRREIEHVVLDYNGTLATDGILEPGVDQRLQKLSIRARIHICSADLHGSVADQTRAFEAAIKILKGPNQSQEKVEFVRRLGPLKVAAVGAGRNDALMVKEAALGIAVIGREGVSTQTLENAEVVCVDILDALDLLLNPKRLAATLQR